MLRLLILLCFLSSAFRSFSQTGDFISVRKKNGRHVKTFMKGSPVIFETAYGGYVDGWINALDKDSVFVRVYDIRTYRTAFGSAIVDTVSSSVIPFHYKEIKRIKIMSKRRFVRSKIDRLLIYGGTGYLLLNIANGAYLGEEISTRKNLQSLGTALGAIAAGYLIRRFHRPDNFSRKKHRIVYVRMS